jgi:hypothetical protein
VLLQARKVEKEKLSAAPESAESEEALLEPTQLARTKEAQLSGTNVENDQKLIIENDHNSRGD